MFRQFSRRIEEMTSPTAALSVVDVYDIAAAIGKEFETLIDRHGPEAVTNLMPKVIMVLEHLECLTAKNQKENSEIVELRYAVEKLQAEKAAKAEQRERYEKELEQIEESWRTETTDLCESVTRLQDENRRLRNLLNEKEGHAVRLKQYEEEELKSVTKLQETVTKQRDELRAAKRDIQQRTIDCEAYQSQLERLAKLNTDYRRKTTLTQQQAKCLIQEKTDLQAQLHDKEQQIQKIKECMDSHVSDEPTSPLEEFDRLKERLHMDSKMVIDMKDPNRPRFTLNELRDVLTERNELKTKLIEVEEELQQYRPEDKEDDELPVHGPINREPFEKLYPGASNSDSGIRKFFRFFFGDSPSRRLKERRSSSAQGRRDSNAQGSRKSSIASSSSSPARGLSSPSPARGASSSPAKLK